MALARVSGNLLADNLQRSENLTFNGNLLVIDVANSKVAIGSDSNNYTLFVSGNAQISNVIVDDTKIISNSSLIINATYLDLLGNAISNVADPVANQDAATKAYVDSVANVLIILEDSGGNTTNVGDDDTVLLNGTANEIDVVVGNLSVTVGLTDDVTIANSLTVTSNISSNNLSVTNELSSGSFSTSGNVEAGNLISTGVVDATGNVSGGNLVSAADVTTVTITATGNVDGGNLNTSGQVVATGNVSGGNVISSGDVTTSTVTATGNISGGNLTTTGIVDATGNVSGGNLVTAGDVTTDTVTATGNISGGNLTTTGIVDSTGNVTGGNIISLGSLESQNVSISGTTITSDANLSIATTSNGNIDLDVDGSGVVSINSTTSLTIPVGNTAQRPGTPETGALRFNTTTSKTEVYTGAEWETVGETTTVTSDEFDGDGSTVAFTLSETATTDTVFVVINGTVQEAGAAYTVSGTTLTFVEAPANGDRIQARSFFTAQSVNLASSVLQDADNDTKIQVEESADEDTIRFDIAGSEVANITANTTSITNDLVVDGAIKSDTFYFVKRSTNTNITYPGSYGAVTIDYEDAGDDYGSTDAMWSSATDRFTPTVAGLWYFRASIDAYPGTTAEGGIYIEKNGSIVAQVSHIGAIRPQVTTHLYMNGTTDYVQFKAYTQGATTRGQSAANSFFEALLVKQAQ